MKKKIRIALIGAGKMMDEYLKVLKHFDNQLTLEGIFSRTSKKALNLKEKYASRVKAIGFSGHHLGIAIDVAAYTLGAEYVERHYTLDRTWKGTDHSASLEPEGVRKLVRDLKATHQSLTYKEKEVLDIEQVQRDKLKNRK